MATFGSVFGCGVDLLSFCVRADCVFGLGCLTSVGCLIPCFGLVWRGELIFGFGLSYLWFCDFGDGFWGFALRIWVYGWFGFRLWCEFSCG